MIILALAITLVLPQFPAYAVDCGTAGLGDYDSDGFTDEMECDGIPTVDGATVFSNPNLKDLFIYLVPTATSNLPENPLEYITDSTAAGGLGIIVRSIDPALATDVRAVTSASPQKAIRITESTDTSSTDVLGYANCGTPNGLDNAVIYTQRITNFIDTKCSGKVCEDNAGITDINLIKNKFIKHTIAHESGHMMNLTTTYNSRFGGYHYKTGTNVILDQSVLYTDKAGKVTWYLGTDYTAADQAGVKLK
jgi:hypothetical protein